MVNNSTDIKKTNNDLSSYLTEHKIKTNNHLSPYLTEHKIKTNNHLSPYLTELKIKRPRHMTFEIHVLDLDRHKNVAGYSRIIGPNPPLLITGSPTAIHRPI
jgi:primosomal protein N''